MVRHVMDAGDVSHCRHGLFDGMPIVLNERNLKIRFIAVINYLISYL